MRFAKKNNQYRMARNYNKNSDIIKDIIIGMSDGLTVPFALTAGLSGVLDTNHLVIVSGLSEIAAGCISMGLGGYLAGQSEVEYYDAELKKQHDRINVTPALELKEVEGIFIEMGVEKGLSTQVAMQVSKDKNRWATLLMQLELKIEQPAKDRAAKSGGTIAASYLVGGFVPLFPYFIFNNKIGFYVSCAVTILALMIFGFFKSRVTGRPVLVGTIKLTLTGIAAATAAYFLAKAVS